MVSQWRRVPEIPYQPQYLVSRVAVLFFVLQDLALVRHTYQFSLRWFSALFRDALMTCPRSNTGEIHLTINLLLELLIAHSPCSHLTTCECAGMQELRSSRRFSSQTDQGANKHVTCP